MISLDVFAEKVKEYGLLCNQLVRKDTAVALHRRLENYTEKDVTEALNNLAFQSEKLTLANLSAALGRVASERLEREAYYRRQIEAEQTAKLWKDTREHDCEKECRGCDKVQHCPIRQAEWFRGVRAILRGERTPRQVNDYMRCEFGGGAGK